MHIYRHLTANNIKLTSMDFHRELSMESYLIENPDVLVLDDDELSTIEILEAELPVKGGRIGKNTDGRIDLLARYGESTLGILELKLGELNQDHLNQLEDYLSETSQIEKLIDKDIDTANLKYIGVLIGKAIDKNLAQKISAGYLIRESIPVAALTINRYRGQDNNIYVITDTYFQNTSKKFDRTKYIFDEEEYGKSRLVLAVIKKHVENNPDITFSQLESAFPRSLQGSWGCFDTIERAEEIHANSGYKRHFIRPDEIIKLKDAIIAVGTQWSIRSISNFIPKAKGLGYKISEKKQ